MGYDIEECAICYLNSYGNNSEGVSDMNLCLPCFCSAIGLQSGISNVKYSGRITSEFNEVRAFDDVECECCNPDGDMTGIQIGFKTPCCGNCRETIMNNANVEHESKNDYDSINSHIEDIEDIIIEAMEESNNSDDSDSDSDNGDSVEIQINGLGTNGVYSTGIGNTIQPKLIENQSSGTNNVDPPTDGVDVGVADAGHHNCCISCTSLITDCNCDTDCDYDCNCDCDTD